MTTAQGSYRVRLEGQVFEDTAPRLADLDGDGAPEVVTVVSIFDQGAQVMVWGISTLHGAFGATLVWPHYPPSAPATVVLPLRVWPDLNEWNGRMDIRLCFDPLTASGAGSLRVISSGAMAAQCQCRCYCQWRRTYQPPLRPSPTSKAACVDCGQGLEFRG